MTGSIVMCLCHLLSNSASSAQSNVSSYQWIITSIFERHVEPFLRAVGLQRTEWEVVNIVHVAAQMPTAPPRHCEVAVADDLMHLFECLQACSKRGRMWRIWCLVAHGRQRTATCLNQWVLLAQ